MSSFETSYKWKYSYEITSYVRLLGITCIWFNKGNTLNVSSDFASINELINIKNILSEKRNANLIQFSFGNYTKSLTSEK